MVQFGPRLAWLTDIHLDFVTEARAARMCEGVLAARPDAVLLGGDIGVATDLVGWLEFLAEQLAMPIYFVLGNHDYYRSSIAAVRAAVGECVGRSEHLVWLEQAGVVELTERTALVGHGAWGDARLGDSFGSRMQISDFHLIQDLLRLDPITRLERLRALGDEAAEYLRRVVASALERHPELLVLTHVPPFREACWHEGNLSDDQALPFFACGATGQVLLEQMVARPSHQMLVLCGHTHSGGAAELLPNLRVLTAGATYGNPHLQRIFQLL